jgi:hypothetical protein
VVSAETCPVSGVRCKGLGTASDGSLVRNGRFQVGQFQQTLAVHRQVGDPVAAPLRTCICSAGVPTRAGSFTPSLWRGKLAPRSAFGGKGKHVVVVVVSEVKPRRNWVITAYVVSKLGPGAVEWTRN